MPLPVKRSGFTMVELVMIMLVMGILAAVAIPKIANTSAFQARGFTDQLRSAIQYARKSAIAQRRSVCVTLTATSVSLTQESSNGSGNACSSGISVVSPNGGAFTLTAPGSITITAPGTITFDALGQIPSPSVTVTVAGNNIAIEQITGYVR